MGWRITQQKWIDKIIAMDLVDERLERALAHGKQVIDLREHEDDLPDVVRDLTDGRVPVSVIDAVGMEAHGSPSAASVSDRPCRRRRPIARRSHPGVRSRSPCRARKADRVGPSSSKARFDLPVASD
jgi:threonine dehydrogenase-like Zn-dependent dehydrogenase